MKLQGAFPSTSKTLWERNTSCFCQNCFRTSFKPETACDDWRIVDLQRKRNLSILSNSEKAVKRPENKVAVNKFQKSKNILKAKLFVSIHIFKAMLQVKNSVKIRYIKIKFKKVLKSIIQLSYAMSKQY